MGGGDTAVRSGPPKWYAKHPCVVCGAGYGECVQEPGYKCCKGCEHPSRWIDEPWTVEEVEEMWEGRERPPHVVAWLAERQAAAPSSGSTAP